MSQLLQPQHTGPAPELASFEAAFRAYSASLCEFVYTYVRSREIAREVVQDLFLRVWELQETVAPPPLTKTYLFTAVQETVAPPPLTKTYLFTAARNRALRYVRHRRVEARWEERAAREAERTARSADEELRCDELADAAARAVADLPERCRLVFTLSRQQHLSYAEIAQALDVSVSTVETQMWRALKILRAKLAPYLLLAIAILR